MAKTKPQVTYDVGPIPPDQRERRGPDPLEAAILGTVGKGVAIGIDPPSDYSIDQFRGRLMGTLRRFADSANYIVKTRTRAGKLWAWTEPRKD